GGVVATVAALVLGLVGTILFAVGEARQRRQADEEKRKALFQAYHARVAAAVGALAMNDVADASRQLKEAPQELRDWEWRHLYSRLDDSSTVVRLRPSEPAFLPPGPEGLRVGTFTGTGLRFQDENGRTFPELPFPSLANKWFALAGPATGWLLAATENLRLVRLRDQKGRV